MIDHLFTDDDSCCILCGAYQYDIESCDTGIHDHNLVVQNGANFCTKCKQVFHLSYRVIKGRVIHEGDEYFMIWGCIYTDEEYLTKEILE